MLQNIILIQNITAVKELILDNFVPLIEIFTSDETTATRKRYLHRDFEIYAIQTPRNTI